MSDSGFWTWLKELACVQPAHLLVQFDHHVCLVQAIMKLLTSLTFNVAGQVLLVA